jgi:hypothetical protein
MNHVEQTPSSDADSRSFSQEIPHLLCNLKVHYCVYIHNCEVIILKPFSWIHTYFVNRSRRSSVGYGLDNQGFKSRQGLGIFLFTTASRPALESSQPSVQWLRGALSLGGKAAGREADHSHNLMSRSRMRRCTAPLPQYAFMAWCSVKRHRDKFTFTYSDNVKSVLCFWVNAMLPTVVLSFGSRKSEFYLKLKAANTSYFDSNAATSVSCL